MAEREHGTRRGYNQHIYRKETPCDDCKKAQAEHQKSYRQSNPDKTREHRRRENEQARNKYARTKHDPQQQEYLRDKWRKQNKIRYEKSKIPGTPQYGRAIYRKSKSRTHTIGADKPQIATGETLKGRLRYYRDSCWICSQSLNAETLTWDHVKPLSKGGSLLASNMRPACIKCNMHKRNVWPISKDFIQEIKLKKEHIGSRTALAA